MPGQSPDTPRIDAALFLTALATIALFLWAKSMGRHLDHDENQFVASAALLARKSLLPYRDYPYFHMPYQVFVQALVFRATNHLLLGARLVSDVAALVTVGLIGGTTLRILRPITQNALARRLLRHAAADDQPALRQHNRIRLESRSQ